MKKLLKNNKSLLIFIFVLLGIWKFSLYTIEYFSRNITLNPQFIGPIPWANFDGVHYLSIAQYGYQIYQQAFFPLFPLLIKFFSIFFAGNYIIGALFISYVSLFIALISLHKLIVIDFSEIVARWTIIFFLFFPTAFFLGSVYTESLFLAFTFSSFYFIRREKFVIASVLIGFASATKIIGILLLFPLLFEFCFSKKFVNITSSILKLIFIALISSSGLMAYMVYLWITYGDPFLFVHTQPFFGAGRSGGQIILIPQILFRYYKILTSVTPLTHVFFIAIFEIFLFSLFSLILIIFRKKIRISYLIFSFLAIIFPSFSGTFSSMPRYLLSIFPVFIILASFKNTKTKLILLTSFSFLLAILTAYFLRGYFIS